jgi:hypothetical protein
MMRQVYGGSLDAWVSMKPAAAADLASEPWWVQVAAQVFHVDQAIEKGASEIGAGNLLRVDYETMCAEPGAVVASVADLLTANGAEVTAVGSPPKRFEPAVPALRDHRHLADLEAALRMFYG